MASDRRSRRFRTWLFRKSSFFTCSWGPTPLALAPALALLALLARIIFFSGDFVPGPLTRSLAGTPRSPRRSRGSLASARSLRTTTPLRHPVVLVLLAAARDAERACRDIL